MMKALLFIVLVGLFDFALGQEGAVDSSLLRLAEAQWNKTAIDEARISIWPSTFHGKYRLPLTVVIDKKSSWTKDSVKVFVGYAESLFRQCDVQLNPITVVELTHPNLNSFTPSTDYIITRDYPLAPLHRPLVTFNEGTNGEVYANAEYYKDSDFEEFSQNTVFIDHLALALNSSNKSREYFVKTSLAHELLHTLLDVGHNEIPGNILSRVSRGEDISIDQCSKLRFNSLIKVVGRD